MTTSSPPPDRRTAAPTPPRGVTRAQPLSWRNPWTLVLGALAGFQAGVLVTLLATSGGDGSGSADETPTATAPAPAVAVAPAAPPPAPEVLDAAMPEPELEPVSPEPAIEPPPSAPSTTGGRRKRPRTDTPDAATSSVPPSPPARPAVDAGGTGALVEVDVGSEPEGATVRIAGAVWGVTPLTVFLPDTEPVVIRLELAGHAPARLTWTPSGRRALRAVLTPTESP